MDRSLRSIVRPRLTAVPKHALIRQGSWGQHLSLLVWDQTLIFISFVFAYWMRYIAVWPAALQPIVSEVATQNFVPFSAFLPVTFLLMIVLAVLFESKRLYRLPRGSGLLDHIGIIISSTLSGIGLLIVVVFLYKPFFYSRLIFAFAGVNIIVLLSAWRALLLGAQHWFWSHGLGQERVLVVGGTGLGQQVMNGIAAQPGLGYFLVGYLAERAIVQSDKSSRVYRHIGALDDLPQILAMHNIHHVILALPFWEHSRLPQIVQTCRDVGVGYQVAPDLYQLSFDHVDVHHISGVPLMSPKKVRLKGWNLALKRITDVGLIVLAAPVTVPIALLLALLIRLDSRGPALFRQQRIGKNGQPFWCYKFRTMVNNAEERKAELSALNEADGPLFKIRKDPRVTRVGAFLRHSSFDELPQLWNVLRGEMSLVGPRPALPSEVECYEPWHRRRLEVMPGLTGLAQALGRSDVSFDEMVRLDIYYAENWSVGMDLRILLMTIPVVLSGRGAY